MNTLLAIVGLASACGAWVLLQRLVQRLDPEQPGVEGSKGCHNTCGHGHCTCQLPLDEQDRA